MRETASIFLHSIRYLSLWIRKKTLVEGTVGQRIVELSREKAVTYYRIADRADIPMSLLFYYKSLHNFLLQLHKPAHDDCKYRSNLPDVLIGRPGPCWLDIPVDIQGSYIETEDQIGFDPETYQKENQKELPSKF